MTEEMRLHIERTRAQASHAYQPTDPMMHDAMELVEFLTKTFSPNMTGMAVSIGQAMPPPNPLPMLSSAMTIDNSKPAKAKKAIVG